MRKQIITLFFIFFVTASALAQDKNIISIPLTIHESKTPMGILTSRIIFLADQLFRNKSISVNNPIVITSFQNLDTLTETDVVGRLIAEALIHEMHVRNIRVIDYRFQEKITVTEKGEFALSRNIKDIKHEARADFILTGTYTILRDGNTNVYFVNARLININTSEVVSTGQVLIPFGPKPPTTIKIIGGS